MKSNSVSFGVIAVVLVGSTPFAVPRASAQSEEAIGKVRDLNQKAIEAYENLELEQARDLLTQALEICAKEGMKGHPFKARTHVNLGAVLVGGFQQPDAAIKQFQRALEIQSDITLTAALKNPEIEAVFARARSGDTSGEKPGDPEPAEPVAVPAEPKEQPVPPADISGVYHEPVVTAPVGQKIDVRAAVEKKLQFSRLVLAYRPEGASGFLVRDMEKEGEGWYSARIPEPATRGSIVQYYVEARDEGGASLVSNGSEQEPHVVALGDASIAGVDDSSLVESDAPAGIEQEAPPGSMPDNRYFFTLGIGAGYGYASGRPEVSPRTDGGTPIEFSGFAPSNLAHLTPEFGYVMSPGFTLSMQLRVQMVTGATEVQGNNDKVYEPAKWAVAAFARGSFILRQERGFRPFVSMLAGAGEIRHLVNIGNEHSDCGPSGDKECIDTVKAGVAFAGGDVGFYYDLTDNLAFVALANAVLGVPDTTLHFDVNAGLSFGF
jgi:hypothetical protein